MRDAVIKTKAAKTSRPPFSFTSSAPLKPVQATGQSFWFLSGFVEMKIPSLSTSF